MSTSKQERSPERPLRFRFITSTPLDFKTGSGTFVGITTLARALESLGAVVEFVTPGLSLPNYTLQRLAFNERLRFRRATGVDVTVGFDMDGYTIAGSSRGLHIASIKGVIADEMRFESGVTNATMRIQAACERRHVHGADFVVTTSKYSSCRIQELYRLQEPPRVVPELIDLAAWNKLFAAAPLRAASHRFTILSVCRFYPRKRLDVLLRAVARLRDRIPELAVRIVGGGPQSAKLKDFARREGLEGVVTWLEDISTADLAREYSQCDIFCLPSVQEGFGLVFLEAMASGKCIVAARAAAVPEVVRHGVLTPPGDEQALAEAIERLYRSPEQQASLAAAGQDFVKQFDAAAVASLFLDAVRGALEHKSGVNRR